MRIAAVSGRKPFGSKEESLASFGGDIADFEFELRGFEDRKKLDVTPEAPGRYVFTAEDLPDGQDPAELGRGGAGKVVFAFDNHLSRHVAVKQLLTTAGTLEDLENPSNAALKISRFMREARITAQLEHPNIVHVYELGERSDGSLFYTMKLVRGRTLRNAIRDAKNMNERLALLPHFIAVCRALAYAHNRGVIHRDIKPKNVMVGEFSETVVLDWGLARVRGNEDVSSPVSGASGSLTGSTSLGHAIGTPAYMSPEQAEGKLGEIDERSDVWSLGAVLYTLLTDTPPFDGESPHEIIGKVLTSAPVPIRTLARRAPRELVAIVEKAMATNRFHRYANASELLDDVLRYQAGQSVSAAEYGFLAKLGRRLRGGLGSFLKAGTVAAVIAAVAAVAWLWQAERLEREDLATSLAYNEDLNRALQKRLRRDRGRQLVQSATEQATRGSTVNAERLASAALDLGESPEARGLLMAASRVAAPRLLWTGPEQERCLWSGTTVDGRLLCMGKDAMHVMNVGGTGEVKRIVTENLTAPVRHAALSRDGAALVTVADTIRLWEVPALKETQTFEPPPGDSVERVYVSPKGRWIVASLATGTARGWKTGADTERKRSFPDGLRALSFLDGSTAVLAAGNSLFTWDLSRDRVRLFATVTNPRAVHVSRDGKTVAVVSTGEDGSTRIAALDRSASLRGEVKLPESSIHVLAEVRNSGAVWFDHQFVPHITAWGSRPEPFVDLGASPAPMVAGGEPLKLWAWDDGAGFWSRPAPGQSGAQLSNRGVLLVRATESSVDVIDRTTGTRSDRLSTAAAAGDIRFSENDSFFSAVIDGKTRIWDAAAPGQRSVEFDRWPDSLRAGFVSDAEWLELEPGRLRLVAAATGEETVIDLPKDTRLTLPAALAPGRGVIAQDGDSLVLVDREGAVKPLASVRGLKISTTKNSVAVVREDNAIVSWSFGSPESVTAMAGAEASGTALLAALPSGGVARVRADGRLEVFSPDGNQRALTPNIFATAASLRVHERADLLSIVDESGAVSMLDLKLTDADRGEIIGSVRQRLGQNK